MSDKDKSSVGKFLLSPLQSGVSLEKKTNNIATEGQIRGITEGLLISLTFIGLILGIHVGMAGFIFSAVAFGLLFSFGIGILLSGDKTEVPYQWQSYGKRNRVIRKTVDLKDKEEECMECGHDVGIGVEREARSEYVVGGFVFKHDSEGQTYNCACCSTYLNEEEVRTEELKEEEEQEIEVKEEAELMNEEEEDVTVWDDLDKIAKENNRDKGEHILKSKNNIYESHNKNQTLFFENDEETENDEENKDTSELELEPV